jgi:hypothetical protein
MHIITVIDSETKSRIERLVNLNSGYKTMDEFIRRAIMNQIALEEGDADVVDRSSGTKARPGTGLLRQQLVDRSFAVTTRAGNAEKQPKSTTRTVTELDHSLIGVPVDIPTGVDVPKTDPNYMVRPLWGQINRYAPAKVSLRILTNILARSKQSWVDLKIVSAAVCEQAPIIKSLLQDSDIKTKRIRGEGFSAAFPTDSRPSLQRFTNQYLGYVARESGEPQGLLADLSFVNLRKTPEGVVEIGVTDPGVVFVKLASPLVDNVLLLNKPASLAISLEEARFLVSHLRQYRPGELDYLRYVAQRIGEGASNPTALLTAVDDYFKVDNRGMNITDAVLGTMRTGAVSKLVELGTVVIKKDGQRSNYQLTAYSKEVLEEKA